MNLDTVDGRGTACGKIVAVLELREFRMTSMKVDTMPPQKRKTQRIFETAVCSKLFFWFGLFRLFDVTYLSSIVIW